MGLKSVEERAYTLVYEGMELPPDITFEKAKHCFDIVENNKFALWARVIGGIDTHSPSREMTLRDFLIELGQDLSELDKTYSVKVNNQRKPLDSIIKPDDKLVILPIEDKAFHLQFIPDYAMTSKRGKLIKDILGILPKNVITTQESLSNLLFQDEKSLIEDYFKLEEEQNLIALDLLIQIWDNIDKTTVISNDIKDKIKIVIQRYIDNQYSKREVKLSEELIRHYLEYLFETKFYPILPKTFSWLRKPKIEGGDFIDLVTLYVA